jgi:hypothetical protein
MNVRIILILLLYGLLIVCRPGSKKDECKSRLKDKEGVSFCGGLLPLSPIVLGSRRTTDEAKQDFINVILLDCLRLAEARQKCKDASSYQPTIY